MRRQYLLIFCSAATALATACEDKGSDPPVWSPPTRTSVTSVPEADIDSALRQRLAGARPPRIDEHKWTHLRRLYKIYGNNPLWLTSDGLDQVRTFALTNALLNAVNDALRLDVYPIGELATSITGLKGNSKPTADQLAEADVLLTSSFVTRRRLPDRPDRSAVVATFQLRHTITVDSMLGPETMKSLNLPATFRLGQIAANLERFRWLPRSLGSRYVYVNVPAFRLEAYDGGKKVLEHPEQMAQYALGWPLDKIEDAMHNGPNNRQVKLQQKIPVYIVYATAYIRDGQLYFGNDLYDRDGPLVEAVAEGAMPSPQTLQAVEALRRLGIPDFDSP